MNTGKDLENAVMVLDFLKENGYQVNLDAEKISIDEKWIEKVKNERKLQNDRDNRNAKTIRAFKSIIERFENFKFEEKEGEVI